MNDLLLRGLVVAQNAPSVRPDPNAPGAGVVQSWINFLGYIGLAVAVLMVIVGGITWAGARAGNNPKAQSGAGRVVATGFVLGFVIGVAQFAVNLGFDTAGQVK